MAKESIKELLYFVCKISKIVDKIIYNTQNNFMNTDSSFLKLLKLIQIKWS